MSYITLFRLCNSRLPPEQHGNHLSVFGDGEFGSPCLPCSTLLLCSFSLLRGASDGSFLLLLHAASDAICIAFLLLICATSDVSCKATFFSFSTRLQGSFLLLLHAASGLYSSSSPRGVGYDLDCFSLLLLSVASNLLQQPLIGDATSAAYADLSVGLLQLLQQPLIGDATSAASADLSVGLPQLLQRPLIRDDTPVASAE